MYIYIYNLALYHSMEKYQYLIKYELIQIGKVTKNYLRIQSSFFFVYNRNKYDYDLTTRFIKINTYNIV